MNQTSAWHAVITQYMSAVVIMVVLSIQRALRCVEQFGETRDVIHVWQFINQEEYL